MIVSRAPGEDSPSSLAIHQGSNLLRGPTGQAAQRLEAFSHGTRVAVFDLFGSMPVRVKNRASLFSTSLDLEKEVKRLSYQLVALLLAWPATVSVSLREAKSGREMRLKCPNSLELPQRTSRLLTQVGLADSSEQSSWIPVAAAFDHIAVHGCISSIPVATRKAQIISLGITPIESSIGGNVLFEEVNEIFAASSFGLIEAAEMKPGSTETPGTAMPKPRKGLEKWPMFYLKFKFQSDVMATEGGPDILQHQSPALTAMISLLRAVCHAFLKKLKMRPRKFASRQKEAVAKAEGSRSLPFSPKTPNLGTPGGSRSPFDTWRRIKVGHQTTSHSALGMQPLVGPGGQLLRKPFLEEDADLDRMLATHHQQRASDSNDSKGSVSSQQVIAMPEALELAIPKANSQWLDDVIRSWENPVFETAEPGLRHLRNAAGQLAKGDGNVAAGSTGTNISGRVSKRALQGAEVIAQVDNKFVLVKLPLDSHAENESSSTSQPSYALFLVDQHAADERCRLEQLMAGYFAGRGDDARAVVETLDQPIYFDILTKELQMFANHRKHMAKWGIVYQIVDFGQQPNTASERIAVTDLPPSILERCRGEPRLLIELLRNELWNLEERPLSLRTGAAPNPNFHGCPRGILELLHSRACRSKRTSRYYCGGYNRLTASQ